MGYRASALALAGVLLAVAVCEGRASERLPTMVFGVDGSIPLSYVDDRFQNPAGRVNYLTSPYLRFSLDGKLLPELSYSLYTSGGFDKYPSRSDSDSTFATLGASMTRRWGDFRAGISIEQNHAFDGIFGPFLYIAHDLGFYASYAYTDVTKTIRIKPGMSLSRRFSDDPSAESYVVSFKVDFEKKLSEKWWATLTPRLRYQNFLGGENTGRQDTIFAASTGLRYAINDHIGLSASIGYERRISNVDSRNFDSYGAGLSLDFSHTFGTNRK